MQLLCPVAGKRASPDSGTGGKANFTRPVRVLRRSSIGLECDREQACTEMEQGCAVLEKNHSVISQLLTASRFHVSSSKTWQGIVLCALTALVLVRSERRLEATVQDLRQHPSVDAVKGPPISAQILIVNIGSRRSPRFITW